MRWDKQEFTELNVLKSASFFLLVISFIIPPQIIGWLLFDFLLFFLIVFTVFPNNVGMDLF